MKSRIQIGEFARLTGITVKTVLHYHKIGLMAEPERSPGGYRLYGPQELNRMQMIKRLKSLGLSLDQIKGIIGEPEDNKSMRSVLESLHNELLVQIEVLQKRVEKIRNLLNEETLNLIEAHDDPPTFRMMTEKGWTEQYKNHPELMEQERQILAVLDDFEWGLDHQDIYREMAEYFQSHPQHYQLLMDCNERLAAIADLPEDAPEVEELARDSIAILKGIPLFEELFKKKGPQNPFEPLINEMLNGLMTPAQVRYCRLCQQYVEDQWGKSNEK
ncbi:MAG TPA: MerR family transcriptional regulator [Syntrophomonadaceae bacterium]|nr:MerR family transcriptional regulator [Syntrophomonadaceae bacterium]